MLHPKARRPQGGRENTSVIAAFYDMDAALPILFELACGIFLLVILEVRA